MIWSLYATLGYNMWFTEYPEVPFEDEAWDLIVRKAVENGFNQIVLDLGEGVQYGSHPELAKPGAWTRERVREEVKRLRDMGIELIPKLNFSATHHLRLGDYRKMLGLPKYYQVCRDLITEVSVLFDHPRFIHLAMDEEGDPQFFKKMDLVAYRQGELLWHDLRFLCDCVTDTGSKPWIWADIPFLWPEEFKKRFKPGSVMLSPWNYRGLKSEHYTPIESNPAYVAHYEGTGYKYVEEDPLCVRYMTQSVPMAEAGYEIVPCTSICFGCMYNPDDVVEYFAQNAPKETLAGFIAAPWLETQLKHAENIIQNIEMLKTAREKFCK